MSLDLVRTVARVLLVAMMVAGGIMSAGIEIGSERAPHPSAVASVGVQPSGGCEHRAGASCEVQAIAETIASPAEPLPVAASFDPFRPPFHRGTDPSAEPDPPRTA